MILNHQYHFYDHKGTFIDLTSLSHAINQTFDHYESQVEAAIKTGLLEEKEIGAIKATIKALKERLKVETAE
jgi:hypothetical protein